MSETSIWYCSKWAIRRGSFSDRKSLKTLWSTWSWQKRKQWSPSQEQSWCWGRGVVQQDGGPWMLVIIGAALYPNHTLGTAEHPYPSNPFTLLSSVLVCCTQCSAWSWNRANIQAEIHTFFSLRGGKMLPHLPSLVLLGYSMTSWAFIWMTGIKTCPGLNDCI